MMSGDSDREGDATPRDATPHRDPDNWADIDVDTAFTGIVAHYSQADQDIGPWSAAEDLEQTPSPAPSDGSASSGSSTPSSDPGVDADPGVRPPRQGPGSTPKASEAPGTGGTATWPPGAGDQDLDEPSVTRTGGHAALGPSGETDDLEDDLEAERFVPPEPPPLPRGGFSTTFAWVCLLGGPLFLVFGALAWKDVPGGLILTAVAAFIGGFVMLVARLPRDHPDDPDDGAVV